MSWHWQKVELKVSDSMQEELKAANQALVEQVEQTGSLLWKNLEEIQQKLTQIIAEQKPILQIIKKIKEPGNNFFHVNLFHDDAEILNLPWEIAKIPGDDGMLSELPRFYLSKNPVTKEFRFSEPSAGPLKILIMFSSPQDLSPDQRLDIEREEFLLLQALQPLYRKGEVQIDFTNVASLEELEHKIARNDYHILHFSGHGIFNEKENQGYLLSEDPVRLNSLPVTGCDFAEKLIKPDHCIPLVVLSACQSGKTSQEKTFAGVAEALLVREVPMVISMSLPVKDFYATDFAAEFYRQLSLKQPVPIAFAEAQKFIRSLEAEHIRQSNARRQPAQWTIPRLFMQADMAPVDWKKKMKPLQVEFPDKIFVNLKMQKSTSGDKDDLFIGRKDDFAAIMPALKEKRSILLTGQGGIGKTRLAKQLTLRLKYKHPDLVAFIFNEEGTKFSLTTMLEDLESFCAGQLQDLLVNPYYLQLNEFKRLLHLLTQIPSRKNVLYLFDNLETFQNNKPGEFTTDNQSVLQVIAHAMLNSNAYVILTDRYEIPELKDAVSLFSLKDISRNDFIRKCLQLKLENLTIPQMETLYQTLGGNFRSLEFFHSAYAKDEENLKRVFKDIEQFRQHTKKYTDEALQKMADNLIFKDLWAGCGKEAQKLARQMYHYQLPVTEVAFSVQGWKDSLQPCLQELFRRTLIQVYYDREAELYYFYMPPLVKELTERNQHTRDMPRDLHRRAGNYHLYMFHSVKRGDILEHEAAFWHFVRAGDSGKAEEIANPLASFYYDRAFYRESCAICLSIYELLKQKTPFWCLNRLGLNGLSLGDYDFALPFLEEAKEKLLKNKTLSKSEKKNIGTILNNISQIYDARGDYDTALQYLKQSLKIRQEIGDKSGQGTTLNNISQIFKARGDYDTALQYLKQSLKISQEIGDIAGEAVTCFNMARIFDDLGDIKSAILLVQKTVIIDIKTQHPDLKDDAVYLMQLIAKAQQKGIDVSEIIDKRLIEALKPLFTK